MLDPWQHPLITILLVIGMGVHRVGKPKRFDILPKSDTYKHVQCDIFVKSPTSSPSSGVYHGLDWCIRDSCSEQESSCHRDRDV